MAGSQNPGFLRADGTRATAKLSFFTCWPWDRLRSLSIHRANREWISTFEWRKVYDIEYLYAGPLFIHQMSHLWLDFRGIHDDFNRQKGTIILRTAGGPHKVHQQYGIANPLGFAHYHKYGWGLTRATDRDRPFWK